MSISLSRSSAVLAVLLAASTFGVSSLFAQEVASPAAGTAVVAEVAEATAAPRPTTLPSTLAWGVPAAKSPFVEQAPLPPLDVLAFQDRVRGRTNIAMMGVGGAAMVTGLILGGDTGTIIATTGAVVGLVGLYRYLR